MSKYAWNKFGTPMYSGEDELGYALTIYQKCTLNWFSLWVSLESFGKIERLFDER